ncbi:hypothetical protein BX616_008747, partial [Lobosporangium transversale]
DEDHPESRGFRAQLPYNITALKALLDIMVEMDNDDSFAPDYDFCVSVNSARDEEHKPVGGIVVFAQWANLKGAGQLYDPTFFNKIRAACGGSGVMRPHDGIYMDDDKAPLSVLCSHWLFPIAREYQLPYYKRTYLSNSRAERLKQTGWTTWVTDRIQSLEGDHYTDNKNGVFVSCQFQYAGGRDSTYRKNGTDGYSSYSWRDSTFGCTLDAFYDEKVTNAKTLALDWVTKNDQEGTGHQGAKFSEQDRRLLWGSFDLNLPDRRLEYYDEHPTKYDRLSAIKLKNDPELIFTSNAFAVGPLPDRVTKALHKAQLCEHKYGFSLALHHQGDKAGDNMPSAHTLLCDEDAESKPSHKPMCLHAVGSKLDDIKRERISSLTNTPFTHSIFHLSYSIMVNFAQVGFQGKVIQRGDEAYEESVYQYAWSSYEDKGTVEPAAVIYALDDSDVQLAIKLAKQYKFGIAIRTGGHHYTGASSAWDQSIQVDVSDTYTDFTWENDDKSQVTLGISITLGKFQSKLRKANRFIPTGQCSYVNLGGHVQTGGYGQLIRSFGLLADYVQKVRIITADGNPRWVVRGVEADKDLLYGILGGSPGNFGVITDVTLNLLKDEDYPESRGFRAVFKYTPETLKRLLDVMVDMDNEDESTAGDYDYCISFTTGRPAENRLPGIVVFAQWANLQGAGQPYDPSFFNKIREAGGGSAVMKPHDGIYLDDDKAPLSVLCSHWIFPTVREFQLPYFKRTYISNSRNHKQNGWTTWVTGRIQDLEKDPNNEIFVSAQFQYSGGKFSAFRNNGKDGFSSLSWRDSTFGCTLDAFYNKDYPASKAAAEAWVNQNDQESVGHHDAKFSEQDRRLLWGSHNLNLPEHREQYYDEHPTKYDRISEIKQKYDPELIFTANAFAVGPLPERVAEACHVKFGFSAALFKQGDAFANQAPSAHLQLQLQSEE